MERGAYLAIYPIVSPPRCSSTVFTRVFSEHPLIRYCSHAQREVTYLPPLESCPERSGCRVRIGRWLEIFSQLSDLAERVRQPADRPT